MCYWWIPLAASGLQAADQNQSGKEAEAAGKREAAIGELQAQDATARGGLEEQRYRRELAQIVGAQKSAIASRNVRQSGTALDLLSDTAMVGGEDIATIRNDAAREAWGYRVRADESRRWGGQMRRNAGRQAGATLLTGAADSYGMWMQK